MAFSGLSNTGLLHGLADHLAHRSIEGENFLGPSPGHSRGVITARIVYDLRKWNLVLDLENEDVLGEPQVDQHLRSAAGLPKKNQNIR